MSLSSIDTDVACGVERTSQQRGGVGWSGVGRKALLAAVQVGSV